ncbi:HupE/UreJ family protein [bacterium SCSIO 12827]|nr:HupE/UreJ family protein [bacterium SCSIO 12827]
MLTAAPALAHTGVAAGSGFAAGFAHPVLGLDHVLAMVAVGILAAQMGGRSLWLVPAAFVAMMAVGGLMGVAALALPFVEIGIVGSVVVLGAVIAAGRQLPAALAMVLVGALALFHGHAHGMEMPVTASGLEYGIGFMAATAALHMAGIGSVTTLRIAAAHAAPVALRAGGASIALAGMALFVS